MTIFVFGNPDVVIDSLPIRIMPTLEEKFPEAQFKFLDPNEEWELPRVVMVIDTVVGVDDVKLFDGLEAFEDAPKMSMHDFDALMNLKFLKKLGKIDKIKIIGVPPMISDILAVEKISSILQSILFSKNE